MVRGRAGPVRGDDRAPAARLPRARALPLHDRGRRPRCCCCCRACRASASRSTAPTWASSSARSPSSRPSSRKIAIVIFLAAYLRDTRQVLVQGARRFLGVTIPPLKHFGPLLVVWGAAMLMLVFIRDLGSSLMFFGGFLALLYVATNRLSFVLVGLAAVRARRVVLRHDGRATCRTASTSGRTRSRRALVEQPAGYQIAQSLFAQADGGLFGTGFGQALLSTVPTRRRTILPAAAHRPDLRGDRQRARAGRRVRAAARLPAVRRARVQDRDARARLVLEAARRRA